MNSDRENSFISRLKYFQTKIYKQQVNIAQFIKERRTIQLLNVLRNYSALAVVISVSILVISANLASGKGSRGFLFGHWDENSEGSFRQNKIEGQMNRKNNLALVPLAQASVAIDPNAQGDEKEEETLLEKGSQNQVFVSSDAPAKKDPEEDGGVKIYKVKSGDTISSIAATHNITTNTILWANDIEDIDSIMPGDKIFILPVSGLSYVVKSGDTLNKIAKKYEADKDRIIAFNNDILANGEIEVGQEIIIPGGRKEDPAPQNNNSSGIARRQYATPSGGSPDVSGWKKLDGKAGTGHSFPYGYCTWYVAQKRYIPWGGNAGTWLYHAKAHGYKTGKTPSIGSIIVTSESWWGHVGIVEKVSGNTITISEMNYKGWGKVSRRTLSSKSRVIKGFIY